MQTMTKSQLLKEVRNWFIEGIAIYLGVAAFVALVLVVVYTSSGGITFGDAPVTGFFKVWGLLTASLLAFFMVFRIFLLLVELVLFILFAIGYIGYKWWKERKNMNGPSGPPSLRDRYPGEPPHH